MWRWTYDALAVWGQHTQLEAHRLIAQGTEVQKGRCQDAGVKGGDRRMLKARFAIPSLCLSLVLHAFTGTNLLPSLAFLSHLPYSLPTTPDFLTIETFLVCCISKTLWDN